MKFIKMEERCMLKEFKKFALRGNMIDLAVGVIIGGAFNALVTSLVNDIIMPILSLLTGKIDFSNLFIALDGNHYDTLAAAQELGVATVNYGTFISGVINFIIMAFVVFLLVKGMNKLADHGKKPAEPTTKKCPYCLSEIDIKATRCPHCTSQMPELAPDMKQ
jgi:large conductance mechanosensitive channel